MSVRGAGVNTASPATRGRSKATRLDAGEHTHARWRSDDVRPRPLHLAVDRSPEFGASSKVRTVIDGVTLDLSALFLPVPNGCAVATRVQLVVGADGVLLAAEHFNLLTKRARS